MLVIQKKLLIYNRIVKQNFKGNNLGITEL